jgi:hypothetical protein
MMFTLAQEHHVRSFKAFWRNSAPAFATENEHEWCLVFFGELAPAARALVSAALVSIRMSFAGKERSEKAGRILSKAKVKSKESAR